MKSRRLFKFFKVREMIYLNEMMRGIGSNQYVTNIVRVGDDQESWKIEKVDFSGQGVTLFISACGNE